MSWEIRQGDALDLLRDMPSETVQTVVTSPPYWGLRDYGNEGQLGLEPAPDLYVQNLVEVFREVRRVLREDGTVWLNLGDSYAGSWGAQSRPNPGEQGASTLDGGSMLSARQIEAHPKGTLTGSLKNTPGLKPKDLCGIPWRVAFALQADGWWLRSDIIWSKPNPMPESVTDRPTRSHEYVFMLSKSSRYFFDQEAVREPHSPSTAERWNGIPPRIGEAGTSPDRNDSDWSGSEATFGANPAGRNIRSVWNIATQPFPGSHFAVFPTALVEPCILAGSSPKACGKCGAPWERLTESERSAKEALIERTRNVGGRTDGYTRTKSSGGLPPVERLTTGWKATCYHADSPAPDDSGQSLILDPFAGSGTVGVVALRHNRSFLGLELNPDYCEMARNRIRDDAPLLNYGLEAA